MANMPRRSLQWPARMGDTLEASTVRLVAPRQSVDRIVGIRRVPASPVRDQSIPQAGREKNRNPCIGLAHQHRNRGNPRRIGLGRLRSAMHMFRLPAQYVDKSARRHACLSRDRLPLHGPMDGPFHRRLCPDGRRRGELDRRGAVLETGACVSEPRRRALRSFRHSSARDRRR
jgi:hypothetical protein